jgi:hypothetical protein
MLPSAGVSARYEGGHAVTRRTAVPAAPIAAHDAAIAIAPPMSGPRGAAAIDAQLRSYRRRCVAEIAKVVVHARATGANAKAPHVGYHRTNRTLTMINEACVRCQLRDVRSGWSPGSLWRGGISEERCTDEQNADNGDAQSE